LPTSPASDAANLPADCSTSMLREKCRGREITLKDLVRAQCDESDLLQVLRQQVVHKELTSHNSRERVIEGQMSFPFKVATRAPCKASEVSRGTGFPASRSFHSSRFARCSLKPAFGTCHASQVFQGQGESLSRWKKGTSQQGRLPHAACGLAVIGVEPVQDRESVGPKEGNPPIRDEEPITTPHGGTSRKKSVRRSTPDRAGIVGLHSGRWLMVEEGDEQIDRVAQSQLLENCLSMQESESVAITGQKKPYHLHTTWDTTCISTGIGIGTSSPSPRGGQII
jgi:hypothetical protein